MSKNLIPEIIKILGVEYGEEFKIRRPDYEVCENGVYAFFEDEGLMKKNKQGEFENNSSIKFEDLCLGNYEVVKLPWEPKQYERYYYPSLLKKEVFRDVWWGRTSDCALKVLGMVYKTEAEAKKHFAEDFKKLTGRELE